MLTTEYAVAGERAKAKAVEIDGRFQAARLGIITPRSDVTSVGRTKLQAAVRRYVYDQELANERSPPTEVNEHEIGHYLEALKGDDEEAGGSVHLAAMRIVEAYKLKIGPGDINWVLFVSLVRRAEHELAQRQRDRLVSKYSTKVYDGLFEKVLTTEPPPAMSDERDVTVSELISRFEADPTRAGLTESAGKKYLIPFAVLREVVGDDFVVRNITRAQCSQMVEVIAALPRNYTKFKAYSGKSLREVGMLATADARKRLSSGTVEVYVHHLSAFFNYAIQKGVVENNPASRLVPKLPNHAQKRLPFNTLELNSLISHLPTWCEEKRGGRFWLPLIALFSGMRLGEIAWLRRDDVKTVDNV